MSRREHASGPDGQRTPGGQQLDRTHRNDQQPRTGQHDTRGKQHGQQTQTGQHEQPRRQSEPTVRHRSGGSSVPTGFRLVSLAFFGMGLALVFGGLTVVQGASAMSAYAGPISSSLTLVGLVLAGLGVGNLAAGYGTWTFASWGRQVGLYVSGAALLGSLSLLTVGGPAGPVGLLVHGAIAWYLYSNGQQYNRFRQTGA